MSAAVGLTISCSRSQSQSGNPTTNDKLMRILEPELSDVLDIAARAPSGHNTQPWTIPLLDRMNWILGVADARGLPAVDAAGRGILLSVGTLLEILCVASQHYGFAVDTDMSSANSESPVIFCAAIEASISFRPFSGLGEASHDRSQRISGSTTRSGGPCKQPAVTG